jgi:large subunit ribosomal protein L10
MDRNSKQQFIENFGEKLSRAKLAILTDYRGLDVNTLVDFRKTLAGGDSDIEFRVVKNTLLKRVIEGTGYEALSEHLTGPNAILLGYDDPVAAAKALKNFLETREDMEVKGGAMEGKSLTAEQVKNLADMPSKEVMQAMLLGVLQAPSRNLVSLLANVNRQLLNVLTAYKGKLEEG